MKPLRLEMTAFGPFSGQEVIDFAQAKLGGLLLIHGATGAGKSTILDAICFALYGDTSGADRQGKEMRCDLAEASLLSSVCFDFSLGEKKYRVRRSPEQMRPSKRGGGETKVGHKAVLWDRSDVSEQEEEGKILASSASKVKQEVSRLFGFESAQFRQVVMLPQGKFQKLLMAESKEKEKILEQLFQTQRYSKVESFLAKKVSVLRRAFDDDQVRLKAILEREGAEDLEGLETLVEVAMSESQKKKEALPTSKKASEEASLALQKGQGADVVLNEMLVAQKECDALEKKVKEIESLQKTRIMARRAVPLKELASALGAREKEKSHAEKEDKDAKKKLEKAKIRKRLSTQSLEGLEACEQRVRAMEGKELSLVSISDLVFRLDSLGKEQEKEKEKAVLHLQKLKIHAKEWAEEKIVVSDKEALHKNNEKLAATLAMISSEVSRVEACLKQAKSIVGLEKESQGLEIEKSKIENSRKTLLKKENGFEKKIAVLEEAWIYNQASVLAAGLEAGDSCPVCGSEKHPRLAEAVGSDVSEEILKEEKAQYAELKKELEQIAIDQSCLATKISGVHAKLEVLREELKGSKGAEPELAEELSLLQKEKSLAQAAQASLQIEQKEIVKLQKKLLALEQEGVELGENSDISKLVLARLKGSIQELETKVPKEWRAMGALDEAKEKLKEELENERAQVAAWLKEENLASQDLSGAEVGEKHSAGVLVLALSKKQEAQKEFDKRRIAAGFSSMGLFEKAQAEIASLPQMDAQILDYEGRKKAASSRQRRAKKAAIDVRKPDMEMLVATEEARAAALEVAIAAAAHAQHEYENRKKSLSEFRKVYKKVEALEQEYQLVAGLSELANGKVPPKISFQRYVLAALLDEVLLAATERLIRMSKGRYRLARLGGSLHKAKASGLDLEVVDLYTGVGRSVKTLSGGESFLAALALSLGLADVVQQFSGGIHLETLFVDEGFGSLDADALDLALSTLTDIHTEDRLIGIISHVGELKERIPRRLLVKKGPLGSYTKFEGA